MGLAPVLYGLLEARNYQVKRVTVPVLPAGAEPVTILQLSDFHLRLTNRKLIRFLESLRTGQVDVVLATGDLLGDPEAVDECVRLLNGVKARIGRCFVFGSSDYYAPMFKSYFDYFRKRRRHGSHPNPTTRFRSGLLSEGWIDLNNSGTRLDLNGVAAQLTGLDDPHLHRDDRRLLIRDPSAKLAILVVHDPAPYGDALRAGYDLVVAGHTHGGQVRLPFVGAVVTNSTLPRSLARGLSRVEGGWLFVSPGLGTGKYAPFRFLCPPEASLIQLVQRSR